MKKGFNINQVELEQVNKVDQTVSFPNRKLMMINEQEFNKVKEKVMSSKKKKMSPRRVF
jgi:hypothetical protein